jgi:hypothetical protein
LELFEELASASAGVEHVLDEVDAFAARAQKENEILSHRDNLVQAIHSWLKLSGLWHRLLFRVSRHMVLIVVTLGLLAYWSAAIDNGFFAASNSADREFVWSYCYYGAVSFFTIGFGDLTPGGHFLGYLHVGITLLSLVFVLYFTFSKLSTDHFVLEARLRDASRDRVACVADVKIVCPLAARGAGGVL